VIRRELPLGEQREHGGQVGRARVAQGELGHGHSISE
jgi:hypothetical protein